jgi:hypothetical protein
VQLEDFSTVTDFPHAGERKSWSWTSLFDFTSSPIGMQLVIWSDVLNYVSGKYDVLPPIGNNCR